MAKIKITKKDVADILKKRWWVMLIELALLGVLIALDLVSKHYAVKFLESLDSNYYVLVKGALALTYTENTGAGFGIFQNNTTALIVVTMIVLVCVTVFLIVAQKQNEWLRISLILILGGGIGNIVDRIGLGYVRDFIEYTFIKNFAICNVADFFVTLGAVMLIIVLIVMLVIEGRKNKKEFEAEQAKKAAEGNTEEGVDPLDAPLNLNPMLKSENDYTFVEQNEDETCEKPNSEAPQDESAPTQSADGAADDDGSSDVSTNV